MWPHLLSIYTTPPYCSIDNLSRDEIHHKHQSVFVKLSQYSSIVKNVIFLLMRNLALRHLNTVNIHCKPHGDMPDSINLAMAECKWCHQITGANMCKPSMSGVLSSRQGFNTTRFLFLCGTTTYLSLLVLASLIKC